MRVKIRVDAYGSEDVTKRRLASALCRWGGPWCAPVRNGATPKQVQTWPGHAGIQTTWDIYGHLWREFQDEQPAARAAEQILLS